MQRLRSLIQILFIVGLLGDVQASQLTCSESLSKTSRLPLLLSVKEQVERIRLKASNIPEESSDMVDRLTQIREEYLRVAFKVDVHKGRALRRVSQKLGDLIEELEWGNRDDTLTSRVSHLIAIYETQKALKSHLGFPFQAEELPYLFTEIFESGRSSIRHGLKIKIRGEAHSRIFASVRFIRVADQWGVEIVGSHFEDRHAVYR